MFQLLNLKFSIIIDWTDIIVLVKAYHLTPFRDKTAGFPLFVICWQTRYTNWVLICLTLVLLESHSITCKERSWVDNNDWSIENIIVSGDFFKKKRRRRRRTFNFIRIPAVKENRTQATYSQRRNLLCAAQILSLRHGSALSVSPPFPRTILEQIHPENQKKKY